MMVRLVTSVSLANGAHYIAGSTFWIHSEFLTNDGWRFRLMDYLGNIVMQAKPELVEPVTEERRLFS